eukprot:5057817-Alexandrium_andersonii.AAC.1
MRSEDVLAAAAEHLASGGLDPSAMVPVEAHFQSRDEIEREAVRATVLRLPEEQSRQAVLERGHDAT